MKQTFEENCRICGSHNRSVLYKGPIRVGKFGHQSKLNHVVWKCEQCKAGFLNRESLDYESEEYRKLVDGESSPEHFYEIHDKEQTDKLQILGTANLRGKVIIDVGCGAGSFLDLVQGFAAETIAIEPTRSYHAELKKKGHKVYSFCHDALKDLNGKADIVVAFAVLEHVECPLKLLKEIKLFLKPTGFLLMSTPNYEDWLIGFLPESYGCFFFRYVHTWYFNSNALQNIASIAGFSETKIKFVQRFDLSNALLWIRDHKPSGHGKVSIFEDLDEVYRKTLEKRGRSDFLYALMEV